MHISLDKLGAHIAEDDDEGKATVRQLKNYYEKLTQKAELEESILCTASHKTTGRRDSNLKRGESQGEVCDDKVWKGHQVSQQNLIHIHVHVSVLHIYLYLCSIEGPQYTRMVDT